MVIIIQPSTGFASTSKNNDQMDAFLMNDATILRNITMQGHGGFMQVLDPTGQVLTKSSYTQTASPFSRALTNKHLEVVCLWMVLVETVCVMLLAQQMHLEYKYNQILVKV